MRVRRLLAGREIAQAKRRFQLLWQSDAVNPYTGALYSKSIQIHPEVFEVFSKNPPINTVCENNIRRNEHSHLLAVLVLPG